MSVEVGERPCATDLRTRCTEIERFRPRFCAYVPRSSWASSCSKAKRSSRRSWLTSHLSLAASSRSETLVSCPNSSLTTSLQRATSSRCFLLTPISNPATFGSS